MLVERIIKATAKAFQELYGQEPGIDLLQVEKTNREFPGDYTLVVFPLLKYSRKSPQETAGELGSYLIGHFEDLEKFDVVKGFLNITLSDKAWLDQFRKLLDTNWDKPPAESTTQPILVEYSSPNTNKPLHLGHIRNNLLGYSISEILKANGKKVLRINLVNDRGIHICKSMLAWMKWGNGETPESSGTKGDHLVGKYYVLFDQKHKKEIETLVHRGFTDEDAYQKAPLYEEAKELLKQWEEADEDVLSVWRMMNQWAYDGFDLTYRRLGVEFDFINYESKIYLEGRGIVEKGLKEGIFYKDKDQSIWVDLADEGLDKKLLLRSDGTSVYITQDIGTAQRRYTEFDPDKLIYIVGNEQIYHFEVLKKILKKLKKTWYSKILHLSYGMVELPQGRMKSREGTVVDADDLMDEMFRTAKKTTEELGKTDDFSYHEQEQLYHSIGMGALKYYILKVDPKKNMLFNPEESIDFNGNTGPFIQYTYARIRSLFRKAGKTEENFIQNYRPNQTTLLPVERNLIRSLAEFQQILQLAGESFNPALLANYCFELVKLYNHYYQDTPILKRVEEDTATFRVLLSWITGRIVKKSMQLLGIEVPEKM